MKNRYTVTVTMEVIVEAYNISEAAQIAGTLQLSHGGSYGSSSTMIHTHRIKAVSAKEGIKPPEEPIE